MLLAIDVGNTNTVFAIADGNKILQEWRAETVARRTADEHAVWLSNLLNMHGYSFSVVRRVIIATVVPQGLFQLTTLARRYFDCEPLVIGENGVHLGLDVVLPEPREVGADRLVNAVAAFNDFPTNLIIIDFGTATTFDIVGEERAYLGGVISPGINLSMEALHKAAAKLPRIAINRPEKVIGTGTVSAMQSGVFWGYVGMIDGLVERIQSEFGKPMTVLATGGLAHWFGDATNNIQHVDRDLTIKGLIIIDQMNSEKYA